MMLSAIAYSQWELGTYVDDEGRDTEEVFFYQTTAGTFAHNESKEKKCVFFIENIPQDTLVVITVYPFGKGKKETWVESSTQWIKITSPSKEDAYIYSFFDKSGIALIINEDYSEFMEAIKDEGEYLAEIHHEIGGLVTVYKFTFSN